MKKALHTLQALKQPRVAASVALALLFAGGGAYYAGGGNVSQAQGAPTSIPVTVRTLSAQKATVWSEFSGRLQAVDAAEIRPEVSGRITQVKFEDGQAVKAGQVLFVIDPRPFEAAAARAEAALATARTNADFAKVEAARAEGMLKTQAIAQRLYDQRANDQRVADANVKAAEAGLKQANLDLEHAYVRAPIGGRVGRAEITVGNLVQTTPNAPLLTTVVSDRAIYADFEVDEQTYLGSVRNHATGRDQERRIPVQMKVQGDTGHVYEGTVYSFDNQLNSASGTIRARAKFSNANGELVPGMFVSVSIAGADNGAVLLVPERALGFDQSKRFVYVVDKDSKAEFREVELGRQVGASRIVLKGVQAGDRVVVDGLQHIKPGAPLAPTEEAPAVPAAGAAVPAAQ